MSTVLITGYTGFVGEHCSKLFKEKGFEVVGLNHREGSPAQRSLVDEELICNLANPTEIANLTIRGIDAVVHLAGYARNTGGDAKIIDDINVEGTIGLITRIRDHGLNPRIVVASSGAVYDALQQMPLTEESILKAPADARPYEASKIKMEQRLQEFSEMNIVIARPFNHIGIGQLEGFILPDLIKQVYVAMQTGEPILVGNLASLRDYTNVEDIVYAYYLLATAPSLEHKIFNLCSGSAISGEQILRMVMDAFGVVNIRVEVDPSKLRGAQDNSTIFGSNARIHAELGWSPAHNIEDTIKSTVDWYLSINK